MSFSRQPPDASAPVVRDETGQWEVEAHSLTMADSNSPSSEDSPQSDSHSLHSFATYSPAAYLSSHEHETGPEPVASSSSSAQNSRPGRTPSRYDWSKHRATIKRLYIDEDKTLREMLNIMARDHNFVATPRMVKTRLKKWGYSKNVSVKSEEVESLMELIFEAESQGDVRKTSTEVTLATGRTVGLDRVAAHLRRKKVSPLVVQKASQLSLARYHHAQSPSPTSLSMQTPDVFRVPENIFSDVHSYVYGQFSGPGASGAASVPSMIMVSPEDKRVYDLVTASRKFFVQDKPDEAFKLLRVAPARIKELLDTDRPSIPRCILNIIIMLLSIPGGRELDETVGALVRYIAALATDDSMQWPRDHPLRRILLGLGQAGNQSLLEIAVRGYKCLLLSIESLPDPSVRETTIAAWLDLGEAIGFDALPVAYLERSLWESYEATRARSAGAHTTRGANLLFLMAELERQKVCTRGSDAPTARLRELYGLSLEACAGEGVSALNAELNGNYYLAGLLRDGGERDEAKTHMRRAIEICTKMGAGATAARLATELQGWLRDWGEHEESREMESEIVSRMSDLGLDAASG